MGIRRELSPASLERRKFRVSRMVTAAMRNLEESKQLDKPINPPAKADSVPATLSHIPRPPEQPTQQEPIDTRTFEQKQNDYMEFQARLMGLPLDKAIRVLLTPRYETDDY